MDLGTTIIGAVLVIICAIPFVLVKKGGKTQKKQALQKLKTLAEQNNDGLGEYDVYNNMAIALNVLKTAVLFYKEADEVAEAYYLKLNDIKQCKVDAIYKPSKIKTNKNENIAEKLVLCFYLKNGDLINLEFYNVEKTLQITWEHFALEKWQKLIATLLK